MDLKHYLPNFQELPLENIVADGGYTAIFRKIAVVGDSLSSGEFEGNSDAGVREYHDMYEHSWGHYLARKVGSQIFNFSRGGMTAEEYCNSWAEANDFWNPDKAAQAYILALGVNDIQNQRKEMGTLADIHSDWHDNGKTFTGYYSQIIQRLKEISPRSKFFLVSMPKCFNDQPDLQVLKAQFSDRLNELADFFPNTYVIDLYRYAPVYDETIYKYLFMYGHMNPMGYKMTADMIGSYIDHIVRTHMADFEEVGFIGTPFHK